MILYDIIYTSSALVLQKELPIISIATYLWPRGAGSHPCDCHKSQSACMANHIYRYEHGEHERDRSVYFLLMTMSRVIGVVKLVDKVHIYMFRCIPRYLRPFRNNNHFYQHVTSKASQDMQEEDGQQLQDQTRGPLN
jgi:hypothetical protein